MEDCSWSLNFVFFYQSNNFIVVVTSPFLFHHFLIRCQQSTGSNVLMYGKSFGHQQGAQTFHRYFFLPTRFQHQQGAQTYISVSIFLWLKGAVSRDFLLLVFFMTQFPPSPWLYHQAVSIFFSKILGDICSSKMQMENIFNQKFFLWFLLDTFE